MDKSAKSWTLVSTKQFFSSRLFLVTWARKCRSKKITQDSYTLLHLLFTSCHQIQAIIVCVYLSPKIPFLSPLGNMPLYMSSRIPTPQTAARTKVKLYSILSLGPPLSWIWKVEKCSHKLRRYCLVVFPSLSCFWDLFAYRDGVRLKP